VTEVRDGQRTSQSWLFHGLKAQERPYLYLSALRRLLRQAHVAPQCSWNAELQMCDADDAVNIMYAVRAKPNSPYIR